MSQPLEIVEPVEPKMAGDWAMITRAHIDREIGTEALICDLQARVHRLEQLVRAYGLKLQEEAPAPETFATYGLPRSALPAPRL